MIRHVLLRRLINSKPLAELSPITWCHSTVIISLRGRPVLAKLECLQVTGAFKIRGALSAVDAAHREDPQGAVITSSAGNHGLGIAHAASILGVPATVCTRERVARESEETERL